MDASPRSTRPPIGRALGTLLAALMLWGCKSPSGPGPSHASAVATAPASQSALSPTRRPPVFPATASTGLAATPARKTAGVEHVDQSTFDQQVLDADVPVLVAFSARWCGPCRELAPTLEALAAEIRVVKVDIDDNPELADRYGIVSVPSLLIFKAGRMTARRSGLASRPQIEAMLAR